MGIQIIILSLWKQDITITVVIEIVYYIIDLYIFLILYFTF